MKHIENSAAADGNVARRNLAPSGVERFTVTGIKGVLRHEIDTGFGRRGGCSVNGSSEGQAMTASLTSLWDLSVRLAKGRLRRLVAKALALRPRGFIPKDVLVLTKLSGQLQVEWRAR